MRMCENEHKLKDVLNGKKDLARVSESVVMARDFSMSLAGF